MSIANQYNSTTPDIFGDEILQALKSTMKPRGSRASSARKKTQRQKVNENSKQGSYPVPELISGRQKIERAGAAVVQRIAEARVGTIEAIFDIGAQLAIIRAEVEHPDCGFEGKTPDQRYGAALKEVVQTRNHDCDLSSETLRKYRIIATEYADRKQEIIDGKISIRSLFEATRTNDPNASLNILLQGDALPKPVEKLSKELKAKANDLRSSSASEFLETGKVFFATYDDFQRSEHPYLICGSREMAETRICAKLMDTDWFKDIHNQDEELMEKTLNSVVKTIRKCGKWKFDDLSEKIRDNNNVDQREVAITILETKVDGTKWVEL